MNSTQFVFNNKDLTTEIFSYVADIELSHHFKNNLHENYEKIIKFNNENPKTTLIYGQVQSGKTKKIIEYIKNSFIKIKILLVQNSLSMISQYELKFKNENLKYFVVCQQNIKKISEYICKNFCKNIILVVMNNSYRISALNSIIKQLKMYNYMLLMDESDLYFRQIKISKLYNDAYECVHITATPFLNSYNNYFDKFINIIPPTNYLGINNLNILDIQTDDNENSINNNINKILLDDFLKSNEKSMMLINVYNKINEMENLARFLKNKNELINVPIVLLLSDIKMYYNGKIKHLSKSSVSEIITQLVHHKHIILISNRLSSRGINYSDINYTRTLTHQISINNENKTNFLQKCRIMGIKPTSNTSNTVDTSKYKLYVFNYSSKMHAKIIGKINSVCEQKYLKLTEEQKEILKQQKKEEEKEKRKLKRIQKKEQQQQQNNQNQEMQPQIELENENNENDENEIKIIRKKIIRIVE